MLLSVKVVLDDAVQKLGELVKVTLCRKYLVVAWVACNPSPELCVVNVLVLVRVLKHVMYTGR